MIKLLVGREIAAKISREGDMQFVFFTWILLDMPAQKQIKFHTLDNTLAVRQTNKSWELSNKEMLLSNLGQEADLSNPIKNII